MRYDLLLEIPLVNAEGNPVGRMLKSLPRKPKYLPRVGEKVYVLPSKFLEVKEVIYQGLSLYMVHLVLESLDEKFRRELETLPSNSKDSYWRWLE